MPRSRLSPDLSWPALLVCALCLSFVIAVSWISDDAFITLRVVDNFLHGYGLRWNAFERVQVFTHPLWCLLLIALCGVTREYILTIIITSTALTAACLYISCLRHRKGPEIALFTLAGFTLSMAFIDYSTSGLENPLSHLLIVLFAAAYLRGSKTRLDLFLLGLLAALIGCTRLDLLILCAFPLLVAVSKYSLRQSIAPLLLGLLPLFCWELFSCIYYGSFFPNTAFAKLGTGAPLQYYVLRGGFYFVDSISRDPITLLAIAAGLLFTLRMPDKAPFAVGLGSLFYLMYIVRIGGDFMSGRLLSAPFVLSMFIIPRCCTLTPRLRAGLVLTFVLCGAVRMYAAGSLVTGFDRFPIPISMLITDERLFYRDGSLINLLNDKQVFEGVMKRGDRNQDKPLTFVAQSGIGRLGFMAGPRARIIDPWALTDPFLARLPVSQGLEFRIGHARRDIPAGYVQSVEQGANLVEDPNLKEYYEAIREIAQADLFAGSRLQTLIRFQSGELD